ncbi:MAG: WD40 repeat domain-containing serine/threonine protein kinase [Planctomycetota bacterium]
MELKEFFRKLGYHELIPVATQEAQAPAGSVRLFRAKSSEHNRDVAIKVLSFNGGVDSVIVGRFRREAKILKAMSEFGLLPVLSSNLFENVEPGKEGTESPILFFITPWMGGGDLEQFVKRRGPVSEEIAAGWFGKLAEAMHRINANGVIHRDIKPANVLLSDPVDEVVEATLSDFGAATDIAAPTNIETDMRLTTAEFPIGTIDYAAPELLFGNKTGSTASDVFGLAASLLFCLTGKTLCELERIPDRDPASRLAARQNLNDLKLPAGLSSRMRALLQDALHTEVTKRISSCEELAERLSKFAAPTDQHWAKLQQSNAYKEPALHSVAGKPLMMGAAFTSVLLIVSAIAIYSRGWPVSHTRGEAGQSEREPSDAKQVERLVSNSKLAMNEIASSPQIDVLRQRWAELANRSSTRSQRTAARAWLETLPNRLELSADLGNSSTVIPLTDQSRWSPSLVIESPELRHAEGVLWLEFDAGGNHLYSSGRDGRVFRWDLGRLQKDQLLSLTSQEVACVRVDPANAEQVLFTRQDQPIARLDDETATISSLGNSYGRFARIAISPNRNWIGVTGARRVDVIDAKTSQVRASRELDQQGVRLAFSRNGRFLAVSEFNGMLTVWDWNRNELKAIEGPQRLWQVTFSASDEQLLYGVTNDRNLIEYRLTDGSFSVKKQEHPLLGISPTQAWQARTKELTDGNVVEFESANGTTMQLGVGRAQPEVISVCTRWIAVGADSGAIFVFRRPKDEAATTQVLPPYRSPRSLASNASCVSFDDFGHRVAIGRKDGKVGIWDVAESKQTEELSFGETAVQDLAFVDGGKRLLVVQDGQISMRILGQAIDAQTFSGDGPLLSSPSNLRILFRRNDSIVSRDLEAGKEQVFVSNQNLLALAATRNFEMVVSLSANGELQIRDGKTAQLLSSCTPAISPVSPGERINLFCTDDRRLILLRGAKIWTATFSAAGAIDMTSVLAAKLPNQVGAAKWDSVNQLTLSCGGRLRSLNQQLASEIALELNGELVCGYVATKLNLWLWTLVTLERWWQSLMIEGRCICVRLVGSIRKANLPDTHVSHPVIMRGKLRLPAIGKNL